MNKLSPSGYRAFVIANIISIVLVFGAFLITGNAVLIILLMLSLFGWYTVHTQRGKQQG